MIKPRIFESRVVKQLGSRFALVGTVLLLWTVESATQVALDDATVAAAIKAGESKQFSHLVSDCVAIAGFGESMSAGMAGGVQPTGSYDIVLSLAPGRIAFMAQEGKRLYKPLTIPDVPPALRAADAVYVTAIPHKPKQSSNSIDVASPIEHVVLKSKTNAAAVLQPSDLQITPVEWSNLLGGKVQGTSAVATFPLGGVRELPPGEFDMVLVTVAGERRCKVGSKDRDRLFK